MIDRDRMLSELTTAMRRHHAKRAFRRRAAASLAMITVAAGVILVGMPSGPTPRPAVDRGVTVLTNAPRTGLIRTIGDDELLDRLAEIDRPTGLIRTGDRVWLTDPPV